MGELLLSVPEFPFRIFERRPALVQSDPAGEDDLRVRAKLARDKRHVEPDDLHHAGVVADGCLGAFPRAEAFLIRAPDRCTHRLLFARRQLSDLPQIRVVDMAAWEEEQQVAHCLDS